MENIDTDIRVLRVNLAFSLPVTIVHFLYLFFHNFVIFFLLVTDSVLFIHNLVFFLHRM